MTFDQTELDACVSCGLCLTSCPTYDITRLEQHGPRGRIEGMRAVQQGEIDVLDPDYTGSMETCVQCRACELACPSAVPFGSLMETARHGIASARSTAGRDRPAARPYDPSSSDTSASTGKAPGHDPTSTFATLLSRVASRVMLTLVARPRLLHMVSNLLRRTQRLGLDRWSPAQLQVPRPIRTARNAVRQTDPQADVHLHRGCVMDQWFGDVQEAARQALVAGGHHPDTQRRGRCCGALHLHAGDETMARQLAAGTVDAYADSNGPIVVTSAGCGAMMKEYGRLLGTEDAAAMAARVQDLAEIVDPGTLPLRTDLPDAKLSWQAPCHLRNVQRVDNRARDLLAALPGVTLVEPDTGQPCCGAGGGYSLSQPALSKAIGQRVAAVHGAADADLVVSANPGCMLQLAGEGLDVMHVAQVVAARLEPGSAVKQERS